MVQCKETDFQLDIFFNEEFNETIPLPNYYYLDFKDYIETQTDVEYTQDDITFTNEFLTALYSYNRNIGGVKSFDIPEKISDSVYKFHIEYYCDNTTELVETTETLNENIKDYMPLTLEELELSARPKFFDNFAIDKLEKYVEVGNTDQLYESVMYLSRKPLFKIANSTAEQVYNIAKDILCEIISDDMTEFQKVCAIYDYLVYNTKIDKTNITFEEQSKSFSSYLEGVFIKNTANSFGISKAFCLLCAIEGINSRYVYGNVISDESSYYYAINKVQINGNWYIIDIVYACTNNSIGKNIYPSHYFNFLINDNEIKSSFKQLTLNMENAVSNLDYFENSKIGEYDLFIDSIEEFEAVINKYKDNSKAGIECKISKNCDKNELFSYLSIILGRNDIQFSSNSQLYLIKLKY